MRSTIWIAPTATFVAVLGIKGLIDHQPRESLEHYATRTSSEIVNGGIDLKSELTPAEIERMGTTPEKLDRMSLFLTSCYKGYKIKDRIHRQAVDGIDTCLDLVRGDEVSSLSFCVFETPTGPKLYLSMLPLSAMSSKYADLQASVPVSVTNTRALEQGIRLNMDELNGFSKGIVEGTPSNPALRTWAQVLELSKRNEKYFAARGVPTRHSPVKSSK